MSALLGACATAPQGPKPQPKIGLALGGGAAKGFAHVGVIKVLEASGFTPAVVSGTSAGSVVGALYASGLNGFALQEQSFALDEDRIKVLTLFGVGGVIKGDKLQVVYEERPNQEPVVHAVRFTSLKFNKTFEAYRFKAKDEPFPRFYEASGEELEQRLVDGPLDSWEQVTSLLKDGRKRVGEVVQVFDGLRNIHMLAEICDPMHFDKENAMAAWHVGRLASSATKLAWVKADKGSPPPIGSLAYSFSRNTMALACVGLLKSAI